jgi:putative sigma-54 modulation protein
MKINIQSLSFQANDELIDFAKDKISKLTQYSGRVMEAQVTLKAVKSATRDNKSCEIKLAIPGNDLFASKQCNSFEEAILKSSEALKQQLLTWKAMNQKVNYRQEF